MKDPVRGLLAVVFLAACWAARPAAGAAPVAGFGAQLRQLQAEGQIDASRADLYRLLAVRAPERLPAALRAGDPIAGAAMRTGAATAGQVHRCGTPTLRAVGSRLAAMSAADRATAAPYLFPAADGTGSASRVAGKTAVHRLPFWVVTENFTIEWGPDLTDEDGSPVTDADGDGIPDVVQRWADLFEASYAANARALNPADPAAVTAGTAVKNNLIPVYLGNSAPGTALDDIGGTTYAFTSTASPVPYIVVNNNFNFVPANDEGRAGLAKIHGAMKITASHEMFHVLHFEYEPVGVWVPVEDDWWFEASATWMEDEVFDGVNDYYQYYRTFPDWAALLADGLAVDFGDPRYVTRAYGNAVFAKYLAEHVGGQGSMAAVWNLIRGQRLRILPALDAYARANGFPGGGLEELYLGFAGANAVMDYEEGAAYGTVVTEPLRDGPIVDSTPPAYLGAEYRVRGFTAPAPGVTVTLQGLPASAWGAALVRQTGAGQSLVVGAETGVLGETSVGTSLLGDGDLLYAVPSFLEAGATPQSYTLSAATGALPDNQAPGIVSSATPAERAGGFDLTWGAPLDADVAGYVVRWKTALAPAFSAFRTLFGSITAVQVRGLGAGNYDVEVFAYDNSGNSGPATSRAASAAASEDTPVPPAAILDQELDPTLPSGGGGGGGGCFLHLLSVGS